MTLLWIVIGLVAIVAFAFIFTSRRDTALRRSGVLPATGQATMADVERLVRSGDRIAAIRVYRVVHHVGLAEAKKAIDDLHAAA
jgi:ribosomal protein L7/L12